MTTRPASVNATDPARSGRSRPRTGEHLAAAVLHLGDTAVVICEDDHDVVEVRVYVDGGGYPGGTAAVADDSHAVHGRIGEAVAGLNPAGTGDGHLAGEHSASKVGTE